MHHVRAACVLGCVASAACGNPESSSSAVIRDSAGITIVDNRSLDPSEVPIWTLSDDFVLELGVVDGHPAEQFNGVVGAARLADGRIVVADRGSRELRFFDESGIYMETVGGPGGGPGELNGMFFAMDRIHGDTIVASEWPVGTAALFTERGDYTFNVRLGPYWPGLAGHFLPDGSLLADTYPRRSYGNELEWWAAYGSEAHFRPTGWLVRVKRDSTVDTLRTIHGEEWFKTGVWRQNLAINAKPFAHNTAVAWNDEHIFVGETEQARIEVRDHAGTLTRLIDWAAELVAVSGEDRSEFRASVSERARPGREANIVRWLGEVTFPDHKPAFHALLTDRAGYLWVEPWPRSDARDAQWSVFDRDGRLTATTLVPIDLVPLEIGEDYLLVLRKDELDIEFVRLYDLQK